MLSSQIVTLLQGVGFSLTNKDGSLRLTSKTGALRLNTKSGQRITA